MLTVLYEKLILRLPGGNHGFQDGKLGPEPHLVSFQIACLFFYFQGKIIYPIFETFFPSSSPGTGVLTS